ncbi:OmpA family protein [Bdellovibrio bacteriovorus]|uniref:OmpA family protein n=1 Tax=Bdellovibrio bacteriovorus TaxID=959 RepID=UPI0035A58580
MASQAKLLTLASALLFVACTSTNERSPASRGPLPLETSAADVLSQASKSLTNNRKFTTLSQNILFDAGSAELTDSAKRTLNEMVPEINKAVDTFSLIRIHGLSDSSGDSERNLKLSTERAEKVRNYLIARGVAPDKLAAVGKGQVLSSPEATPSERARDRRVDFEIVEGRENGQDELQ